MFLSNSADQHSVGLALHAGGSQLHIAGDESFALKDFCAFVLSDEIRKTLVFGRLLRVL